MNKKQKPTLGFYYIHLCDIDQHDFEKRESLLESEIRKNSFACTIHREVQYLSSLKPLDSSTQRIIENLYTAAQNMELTPMVLIDETLANAYEFIGRLQYGAVIIYDGIAIDVESLINFSSKYVDLAHNYKTNKNMKGHESIQIVSPEMFKFDINKALKDTLEFYRFAPSKLVPINVQMYMRGNYTKLLDALETGEYGNIKDLKTKKAFDITDDFILAIDDYDTTLSKAAVLAILKRNGSRDVKGKIKNQFNF